VSRDALDLTSDGDEGPSAPSPPPRNEEPSVRPRTTSKAPATQPPPPAPALGRGGSVRGGAGSWNDIQLSAPRRFVCSILGCERPFGSTSALLQHQREQDHWPKSAAPLPSRPSLRSTKVSQGPAPADTSSAAARDRSASVPSSTPKTVRTRDAVDVDEEPEEPVVTIPMRKVEIGTFDCGACEVAFSEKTISFYTNEATRFQPRGYPEMIELEMTALTNIEIAKLHGLMCVTGFFGYDVPEHYSSFSVADGPKSRVLFHFVASEGDGLWKGSDRDQQVKSLMQLSSHIKNKTNFNPDRKDFAAELKRFKRRQTGEEHVPKPPEAVYPRKRQPAVSDPPPPLPGGYKVGEKVFFTGASHTFPSGDKLVHGQQGEVTGPANGEATKGKGVSVRFPGNKGDVCCFLTKVHCLIAASAATPPPAPHKHDAARTPSARPPSLVLALPRRPDPSCKPPWPSAPGARRSRMANGGGGSAGEGPGQASPPLAFGR
jgi:hypothetical protein